MKIHKLINLPQPSIRYGSVFRVKGKWPYEAFVDFLLVYYPGDARESHLIVSTGHKAGLILLTLPEESAIEPGASGLSTKWVRENWDKWIYPECPIEDVYVISRYEISDRVEPRYLKLFVDHGVAWKIKPLFR